MTDDNEIIVRQYGLGQPEGDLDIAYDVLRKQNIFWNRLVEIEQANRAAHREILSSLPAVAEIEQELEAMKERRLTLITERKQARKQARRRIPTPELDAAIAALKDPIRDAAARAKAARQTGRAEVRPRLAELELQRRQQVKNARNASGLWWPNYNAVCASYDTARVKAMRAGTELRFHRFDGSGRFTFQVQGGMTPAELFAGDWNQVRVDPVDSAAFDGRSRSERRKCMRTHLQFAIASDPASNAFVCLRFPLFLHRPLPEDARIKMVVVKAKRVASKTRWAVTFTCTRALPTPQALRTNLDARCALNLGFRVKADGLRVGVRVDTQGGVHEYRLPAVMLDRWRHLDDLQQQIDNAINSILPELRSALSGEVPESLARDALSVRSDKIGGRTLTLIARRWKTEAEHFQPAALAKIDVWRKAHKRLYEAQCHTRDKLTARRRDLYRVWAAELVREYGTIRVEDTDYRDLLAKDRPDGTESAVTSTIRQLARFAAPGEFRKMIALAAAKSSAHLEVLAGARQTLTCHSCGHEQNLAEGRNRREHLMWTCGNCGGMWDQDENFARNLLVAPPPSVCERFGGAPQAGERSQRLGG